MVPLLLHSAPILSLPPGEASVLSLFPENWPFLILKVSFPITPTFGGSLRLYHRATRNHLPYWWGLVPSGPLPD